MYRNLFIGAGMIAATVALIWASGSKADEYLEPPPVGWSGSFEHKFVVCDTREQVEDIANLGTTEYAPMHAKLNELYQTANSKGEHTCLVAPITEIVVGESEELGFIIDAVGVNNKAWAVHFGNSEGEWWMLYAVHPKEVEGTAI